MTKKMTLKEKIAELKAENKMWRSKIEKAIEGLEVCSACPKCKTTWGGNLEHDWKCEECGFIPEPKDKPYNLDYYKTVDYGDIEELKKELLSTEKDVSEGVGLKSK